MEPQRIVQSFEDNLFNIETVPCLSFPRVFVFRKKEKLNETIELLKSSGFVLFDVNQYAIIKQEDYDLLVSDFGYHDDSRKLRFRDCLISDLKKRRLIVRAKIDNLKNVINDDHTVFFVSFNDLYLKNEMFYDDIENKNMLYEKVRFFLMENCLNNDIPTHALVYYETNESIRDFCPEGIYVD